MNKRAAFMLSVGAAVLCGAILVCVPGCKPSPPPPRPVARYQRMPLRHVPPYFDRTIIQQADLVETVPLNVSSYGLVSHLRSTGDSTAPTSVRTWMLNQMAKRGFGQHETEYPDAVIQPEEVLKDPHFAIVRVDGYLAPGARKGQTFDVYVSALPEGHTSSLAHGDLYETELSVGGAEVGGANVNRIAVATGPIFVNPAYSLVGSGISKEGRTSLRYGVVLDGGVVSIDRPMGLRLRQPQRSLSQMIGDRINERFQDQGDVMSHGGGNVGQDIVAVPEDEGRINFYVPARYRGDWEHFSGVVMHLFMRGDPEFAVLKGRELANEAVKPDAPLQDITYAWEGLGQSALPTILPLMTDPHPDVAFAAARAAAFLDEPSSLTALMQMAQDTHNSFQLDAVRTLGALPPTQQINIMLRQLLDVPSAPVRVAAYQALAHNKDIFVFTRVVRNRFVLDIVPSNGPTLVYASRSGIPRIAIIGRRVNIQTPLMLSMMDGRLTIASENNSDLSVYFRNPSAPQGQQTMSAPELAEFIVRLAGEGVVADGQRPLDFSYAEILAVLQNLSDHHDLVVRADPQRGVATFALQDLANSNSLVYNAPVIATGPQSDENPGTLPPLNPNDVDNVRNTAPNGVARPQ
ncbi:MAG TPA: flagellar basal body P-ring protein FlgI [Tepidisphaeraceae bacterium]|jgi:hypothetical protein